MRKGLLTLGLVVVLGATVALVRTRQHDDSQTDVPASARPPTPARSARLGREAFVGSAACASCHEEQAAAYLASHHANALVKPSVDTAQARYDGSSFTSKHGGTSTFSLHEGSPVVSTPVADSKVVTFPIRYVSGVWPLQQLVVSAERGKLQALGVVWDSRAAAEGGSHWFHVYGPEGVAPGDPLFFTSAAQNWNHMCAECHSTSVERGYDVQTDSFETRWTELSVGCEACHGPGAEHVRSARERSSTSAIVPLPVSLKRAASWGPSVTGSPTPRSQDGVQVEVCAPCHSRREPLKEGFLASDAFLDSFQPELLLPGRYHADGQVEGEVFEWASFVQSRMYQTGVTCSDCHNPHSGKLQAQGNDLCVRCHEPTRFNVESHSHHAAGKAPLCIDCHMPPSTFMQVDERRDHSIRIPRPEHSLAFGTPNACNSCHTDKGASWARDKLASWSPGAPARPHFVEGLAKDRKGALDAPSALRRVVEDGAVPAIARATALERLGHYPSPKAAEAFRVALAGPEPLLAYGAVLGAAQLPVQQRAPVLTPALSHATRAVRIAAAKSLAEVPTAQLPAETRASFDRAAMEVMQSFVVRGSRAETHVERSAFELSRGNLEQAEASLQTALRLAPCLAEAHLNRADLARQRGDEAGAERAIRAALGCSPQSAAAHHALGLWLVRAHQSDAAIASLKTAVALAPSDTRFRYVLAVALAGSGARSEAIGLLEQTLQLRPNDASALQALAGYLHVAGQSERAAALRQKLDALLRD